jgi:lysophospholipase L1-like esterase
MRRVVTALAAIGLIASFAAPVSLAASSRPVEYLALGDSIAFGYSPFLNPGDAANFVGYPETLGVTLRDTVTNAACPGETSSHFIALGGADHGCGTWRFGYGFPLHAQYSGSQLAFADAFLAAHPKTQLVTIDLGANDIGALRDDCLTKPDPMACILDGMPAMLATYAANLDTIYSHIRNVDGYRHKLVALTFYSPDYADTATSWAISQVNAVLVDRTLAWGGTVADGFAAFAAASAGYGGDTCAAGLRIVNPAPPPACDDHPSAAGKDLLAQTIARTLRAD